MGPWSQPYFMDLVRVGDFVLAYLPNPTCYGHETCTIGYSKDWGLKGCVEMLWQPHQIWSYRPVKSAMFHGFGLDWLICGTISPEPYKLWTWDVHHWIQQRLRFKRMLEILWQSHQIWSYGPVKSAMFHGFGLDWLICGTISPEPYKLWTWDLHHWIQQRLRFKKMCRNIVTTPSDLELCAPEFNHVS